MPLQYTWENGTATAVLSEIPSCCQEGPAAAAPTAMKVPRPRLSASSAAPLLGAVHTNCVSWVVLDLQAPAFTESSEEAGAETAAATESAVAAVKEGAAVVADKVTTVVKAAKTKAERQNAALQRRLRQPAARGKNAIKARKADSWQAWLAWIQENPIYGAVAALVLIIVILAALWPRSARA